MDLNVKKYIGLIHKIREYESALERQDLWWTVVAMVGKVNNQGLEPQLLDSINETQLQFDQLKSQLIKNLVTRYLERVEVDLKLKSQSFIDILNRNLFERTADVGFLATDSVIVDFLSNGVFTPCITEGIVERLQEYVAKYSVYSDVVLLTPDLKVVARVDSSNEQEFSSSDVLHAALNSQDYIEYDRPIDVVSYKESPLYYIQRIVDDGKTVGLLCLSFKFKDELNRIQETLSGTEARLNLSLIREGGDLIYNSYEVDTGHLHKHQQNRLLDVRHGSNECFAYVTRASGYQGYKGLPWLGGIQASVLDSIDPGLEDVQGSVDELNPESSLFPQELYELNLEINTALLIVVLNGKISSLKNNVKAFLPVLDSFQDIGAQVRHVFSESIMHIHQISHQTMSEKVVLASKVALDVMDRNLYERANDCRWWGLNENFKRLLSAKGGFNSSMVAKAESILEYINSLYTVYTLLFIYDKNGQVIALSNQSMEHLRGKNIGALSEVSNCLKLSDTQAYTVSGFTETEFYSGSETYIYHSAIYDEAGNSAVGGIGIVFDSTPEFKAILEDFIPKDSSGAVLDGAFAFYLDESGKIVSTTENTLNIKTGQELGGTLLDSQSLPSHEGGFDVSINGVDYLVGLSASKGYREFKNSDGYSNNMRCYVFVRS